MSMWKTVTVVGAAVGSFLLVKVLAGGFGFVSGRYVADQLTGRTTAEEMISKLRSQGFRMLDTMKLELPGDYAALTRELEAIVSRSATAAQARDEAMAVMMAIRRKHAKWMHQAPDDSLYPLMRSQLELLEIVDASESPAVCARFAMTGPAALTKQDKQQMLAVDATGTHVIRAIGAAQKNPQPIEAATEGDWETVDTAMLAQGGTAEDLQSLAALDPKDENLCKAAIRFYRSLLTIEGPAGRRLRAEIAYGMAES